MAARTERKFDFSAEAVKRAVLTTSLQHPSVVYPAAIGVLGGIAAALLAGSPLAAGAALVGGSVAAASWLVNYLLRRDLFASRYMERMHRALVAQRELVLANLEADLKAVKSAEGSRQLARFREKIATFEEVLGRKFARGEITFGRFLGIAEQVYLSGIDNLNAMVLALKSLRTIDEGYIRGRIRHLEGDPATSPAEEQELAGLKRQLELRGEQLQKVDAHLAMNERALAQLDASIAALADIRTGTGEAALDMETAMRELARIAAHAKDYSTAPGKD